MPIVREWTVTVITRSQNKKSMNAEYRTSQWAAAKAAFLTAIEAAREARKCAAGRIKLACGQDLGNDLPAEKGLKFGSQAEPGAAVRACAYERRATLSGLWGLAALHPESHWFVSLDALRRETAELTTWASPETWEAEWADAQDKLEREKLASLSRLEIERETASQVPAPAEPAESANSGAGDCGVSERRWEAAWAASQKGTTPSHRVTG